MQKGERYITITFRKIRENPPKLENTKDYFSRFFIFIHKTFICNISKSTSFSFVLVYNCLQISRFL